ncbi:16S rRNA (uracil(1498)-N(3))-methyltransferase [Methylophaga sp. OBS3]|uniref:16S rRNA (uracil(1498)-N(3))-methyltransferase n=1 Tax=Methylophaga sp. OBS3 TaxID=2991934 RepID=UPI00224DC93B|nr:16S rRNA (uracil(1498)-N(3))-methyltransferase [Methylophaga sp. OBS3]MCX4190738.1 16S rRNA (uracil(1498)-N(3))-methyltransferase [Methylophaga sp. OBS3]
MRSLRFYYPGPYQWNEAFSLPDTIFRHAIQVLRLKAGAEIQLFDGEGAEYLAEITDVAKREAKARLTSEVENNSESPLPVFLLQGISRGERMDYAIQKAVELGVQHIVPVITERCNVQLQGERADKRWAHWHGVMVSACEQSGRAVLPTLAPVVDLSDALANSQTDCKLVLDPTADQGFSGLAKQKAVTLLIGPEGGLSDSEILDAKQSGYTALRFGPRILRTETASAAALAIVQASWGDIG